MSRKSDVFGELIVGVFMTAVLALLVYFTVVISGVDFLSGKARVPVKVTFQDVGGLKTRDSVIYRGMKVGTVQHIDLSGTNVLMTLSINGDVTLRTGYSVSVEATSLLGGTHLLLEEGLGAPLPLRGTVFHGTDPTNWMRDLGKIAQSVKSFTAGGALNEAVDEIRRAARNIADVSERVNRGEGTLGRLTSKDDPVYEDVKTAVASAKETFENAKTISARVERGEGTLGRFLGKDESVYEDVKASVKDVKDVIREVKASVQDLKTSLANVARFSENLNSTNSLLAKVTGDPQLAQDASALVTDFRRMAANLDRLAGSLAEGKGTLGKLSNDPEMYNELNALIKDVRQVIDNYRDTTPISSFAGLVGGAL